MNYISDAYHNPPDWFVFTALPSLPLTIATITIPFYLFRPSDSVETALAWWLPIAVACAVCGGALLAYIYSLLIVAVVRYFTSIFVTDAERLSALELACDKFRDAVLHQRHQLEEPCLDADQTNAVLGAYDYTIGVVITASHPTSNAELK